MPPPAPVLYPGAKWTPLSNHSSPGTLQQRKLIVLHITMGPTAAGAIATFEASVHPNRVSVHFVIDRDGTIFQLVDLKDTAWHASAVNSRSVGIEHAGTDKLPCTEAQYEASAALVRWLVEILGIPLSRGFVRTHNEASPKDGHVGCCTLGLDPDRVVTMALALDQTASPPNASLGSKP